MTSRRSRNRPICAGDRARAGAVSWSQDAILSRVSRWDTKYLQGFVEASTSPQWKMAAQIVLDRRANPQRPKTKAKRQRKRREPLKTPVLEMRSLDRSFTRPAKPA
jgi:hypothetical protein